MKSVSDKTPTDVVTNEAENRFIPGASAGVSPVDGNSARLTNCLRAILAVVLIADVLDLMDSTITNIGAPTIVREIGGR